jgi:hypothetical protein
MDLPGEGVKDNESRGQAQIQRLYRTSDYSSERLETLTEVKGRFPSAPSRT